MNKLILAAFALFVLVGGYVVAQHFRMNSAIEQARNDELVVQEVSQEFQRQLAELDPEHPIRRRYGKFIEVRGVGYHRQPGFAMGPHLTLSSRAVFEKANVPCSGIVNTRGRLSVTIRMTPSQEWMDKNPTASLRKSGDVFVVKKPGMTSSTSLEFGATHPSFFRDGSDKRDSEKIGKSVDQAISELTAELASDDSSRISGTRQWYQSQKRAEVIDQFLHQAFRSPNVDVRLTAAKLLALPDPGYGKVSHADSTIELLLDEVDDQQQDPSVRAAIVSALLLNYENNRKGLYERLEKMGANAHVYLPVLVDFLGDKSARHHSSGGAFDAPIGAVVLLGSWGPASSDAVPVLIDAMKNHPNQWKLAAVAAKALGDIGPEAKEAIPELILATSSSYSDLREAATKAIEKLHAGGDLPMNYDVINETDVERLGAKFMQGRWCCWGLDPDGKRIWSVIDKDGLSGLYEITLDDHIYRQVASIPTDGLASIHVTPDCVAILRIDRSDDALRAVVDRWSTVLGNTVESVELLKIPSPPGKHRVSLRNVVWTKDGSKVAFMQSVSKPVPGKPRMSRQSKQFQAFDLQTRQPIIEQKLAENLMDPIAFADNQDSVFFYGHCFETREYCLAKFDLSTKQFRPIENSAIPGYAAISVHNDIAVYQGSGNKPAPVKLLNLQSRHVVDLAFDGDAPRLYDPFHYLLSFIDDESVCVIMETTIDVFGTTDGKLLRQVPIFSPKGRTTIRPVLFGSTNSKIVLLASNGLGSSNSQEGLWVRQIDLTELQESDSN